MDTVSRQVVRQRAGARCEYCRLPESAVEISFHIEHITARQHGGNDELDNLALACDRCNLFKGTNLTSVDPNTGIVVAIYDPRLQDWQTHFGQYGYEIVGKTDIGRATVKLLNMNAANRVELRSELGLVL